eukprot:gene19156-21076_t
MEAKESRMEGERTTLFVRNLPYNANDGKLEDIFSEYGPIKRCFVVKDRDKEQMCRGFGYVTFVTQEDANKALATTVRIENRKLKLSIADKKPRQRDNYQPKNKKNDTDIAADVLDNNVESKESDVELKDKKITPTKRQIIEEDKRTVILTDLGDKATKSKLKQLCAKQGKVERIEFPAQGRIDDAAIIVYKSIKSAVRASQKLDRAMFNNSTISACLLKKEGKQGIKKLEKLQLIVRNLSFECTEKHLNEAFGKFGNILKIELPVRVNANGKKKFLGFAFIQFSNQEETKKALEEMNKKELLGRPMIIDQAMPKDKYQKEKGLEESSSKKTAEDGVDNEKIEKKNNVKKSRKEDNAAQEEDESEEEEDESEEEEDAEDEEDVEDKNSNKKKEEERKERLKKQSKDAKEGKTIFLRNLPFEVSEEEIVESFEKYGDIDYCKIVYDQETGHSRGTAFVKYKEIDAADLAVSQAETELDDKAIVIGERRIAVMKAVTKGKVKEIEKQKKLEKKDPKDKRNLYLADEGVIFPNSEAAKELSESDLKKREKARTEKKVKLKNQNYFISKTRLCFRNLPLSVGEKDLKEKIKTHCPSSGKIVRALVMRNRERLDKNGRGRSLGFGFVEFYSHEQAMAVLRATNNNAELFGANRKPIVEFSVENQLALNAQKKRLERQQQKADGVAQTEAAGDGKEARGVKRQGTGDDHKRKGQRREKKRNENRDDEEKGEASSVKKARGSFDNSGITRSGKKATGKETRKQMEKSKFEGGKIHPKEKDSFELKRNELKIRKRRTAEDDEQTTKAKKPKKKLIKDPEEDKFNKLVNKYKEKLFGDQLKKKADGKRWFE